jgi:hypothetical protein
MSTPALHDLPADPRPLAPRHAAVVDGARFTLRWEPVEGARRYRVQIAASTDFRAPAFQCDLSADVVALPMWYAKPGDDSTYFWRVLAESAGGWSRGESIESLTTGRGGEEALFADPDGTEPLGPVALLFSSSSVDPFASETERQPGRRRLENVEITALSVVLMMAVAVFLAALAYTAWALFAS